MDGLFQQVLLEWTSGLTQLPPLGSNDKAASSAISTYLRRRPVWNEMVEKTRAQGRKLSIYSFRHHYSQRLDQLGANARLSASLMGHSRATFERHYGDELASADVIQQATRLLVPQSRGV
jgi:integrase